MPVIIPVFPNEPLYNEKVRLEGSDYIFRFDWAGREDRYYMSIYDASNNPLLLGVKVIANWSLLENHAFNANLPPGTLMAIDTESGGSPPVYEDFGTRVRLFYWASDEDIASLAGAV